MGETKSWAIAIVVLCTVFTSAGSLFMKLGANSISLDSFSGVMAGYPIVVGFFLYFVGFIMLTYSFRHGDLSVLFPFVSLSFVWVAILSFLVLHEPISPIEIAGFASIVMGVVMIGLGRPKKLRLRA